MLLQWILASRQSLLFLQIWNHFQLSSPQNSLPLYHLNSYNLLDLQDASVSSYRHRPIDSRLRATRCGEQLWTRPIKQLGLWKIAYDSYLVESVSLISQAQKALLRQRPLKMHGNWLALRLLHLLK